MSRLDLVIEISWASVGGDYVCELSAIVDRELEKAVRFALSARVPVGLLDAEVAAVVEQLRERDM